MNEDVAEGDDATVFADPGGAGGVCAGELVEGFANDLELTFDCCVEHRGFQIVGKRAPGGEAGNQLRRLLDVVEVGPYVTRQR